MLAECKSAIQQCNALRYDTHRRSSSFVRHWSFLLVVVVLASTSRAEIPEPDTIFYGKIVNRTSQQEDLLTQGMVSSVISRPDGRQITLSTALSPINNGAYSYQI